ncbi:hypothetical protein B0O80DRAFT_447364 [Mortierella sp. GBAus27b]|nr:hypothetical protein B0O80DRAFT_447364 [Mortierella sp. GBAus27b]
MKTKILALALLALLAGSVEAQGTGPNPPSVTPTTTAIHRRPTPTRLPPGLPPGRPRTFGSPSGPPGNPGGSGNPRSPRRQTV